RGGGGGAGARVRGGRLHTKRLRARLRKIAGRGRGGMRTDEIRGHDSGPEGLPPSIIVTAEGTEGEAPELPPATGADEPSQEPAAADGRGPESNGGPPRRRSKAAPPAPAKAASTRGAA